MHSPPARAHRVVGDSEGTGIASVSGSPGKTARAAAIVTLALMALPAASSAQTPSAGTQSGAQAKAALSETYVKEEARLHLSSKSGGSDIAEEGYGHGTFSAGVRINLTVKVSRVTGYFVAYLKGGSISGYASATPHFSGKYVSFKGSLTIKHGSGRYSGASGTASLYGAINRLNEQLTVQVVGRLRM